MKKLILLILVCSLLLLTLTSCLQNDKGEETTPQDITESTTPHQSNDETTTPDKSPDVATPPDNTTVIVPPKEISIPVEEVFNTEKVRFEAQPFIQDASIIYVQWDMRFEISEYGVFIDNTLYDSAKIISNLTITYPVKIASATNTDMDTMISILEKIQNSETCYLLETKKQKDYQVAVYVIDNLYFIVSFRENGIVAKIHYVDLSDIPTPEIPPEVTTPPQNNNIPVPSENNPFGNEEVVFKTKLLTTVIASSWGGFEVRTTSNGEIYLDGVLYENKGVFDTPDIVYNQQILSESLRKEELSKILEKIQDAESYYVLETQDANKYGDKFSIYYINGTYYFLVEYNGKVKAIWCSENFVQ